MTEHQRWTEVRRGLIALFRAHGFDDDCTLERLVRRTLRDLMVHGIAPEQAVTWTDQAIAAWFGAIVGPGNEALGRAAFLKCDGPNRWPDSFLRFGTVPTALVQALQAAIPTPYPEPVPAAMAAQDLRPSGMWSALRRLLWPVPQPRRRLPSLGG